MSSSVTRNLLTVGVIAAGVSCAALFRKNPNQDSPPPSAWQQTPNSHWQAAAYPDAISLPGSASPQSVEATHLQPSVLVGQEYVVEDLASTPTAGLPHFPQTSNAGPPSDHSGSSADVKRLPASINGLRPPADPWTAAAEPPAIASQYSEVRPSYETRFRPSTLNSAATHIVRDGDSLTAIAQKYLGDSSRSDEIFELNRNRLPGPDILPIGVELQLPPAVNPAPAHGISGNEATTAHGRPLLPANAGLRKTGA